MHLKMVPLLKEGLPVPATRTRGTCFHTLNCPSIVLILKQVTLKGEEEKEDAKWFLNSKNLPHISRRWQQQYLGEELVT